MAPLSAALGLTAASLAIAGVVVAVGARTGADGLAGPVFGGLIAPLVSVVASWLLIVRAYRRDPASVMGVTMQAFLAKILFFAVYVAVAIRVVGLPARAFGISFVAWFIVLYAAQAVLMGRLVREGVKGAG